VYPGKVYSMTEDVDDVVTAYDNHSYKNNGDGKNVDQDSRGW
jgi:hypothetical protein